MNNSSDASDDRVVDTRETIYTSTSESNVTFFQQNKNDTSSSVIAKKEDEDDSDYVSRINNMVD